MTADIGLVGLGVMGANLALNMAEKGSTVAVYNRTGSKTDAFMAAAGPLAGRLVPCATIPDLVAAIRPPRPVVIMVQAGEAVDATADALAGAMEAGDMLIDAGNANFRDTRRRAASYPERGLGFLGIGVSGGEEGARHGPSIMAGGDAADYARVAPILEAIAARHDGEPCAALVGPDGAGHFVKTIHNGIEYADMQMIAEIYGILRDGYGLAPAAMADVFARWNEGPLKSYLIEITAGVLAATDPDTDRPMADIILDTAGQKGTGRWSAIEAQDLGVPATVIEAAVAARGLSARRDRRLAAAEVYGTGAHGFGDVLGTAEEALATLEGALTAGKIAAYAQGFEVMAAASEAWDWNLPFGTIARIWRAGCIIRSVFLDDIARAFDEAHGKGDEIASLILAEPFVSTLRRAEGPLRQVVAAAALHGVPVPALGSALAYFDISRSARTTANLIQGQRDFFGAHGFERTDREGRDFHGPWAMGLGG